MKTTITKVRRKTIYFAVSYDLFPYILIHEATEKMIDEDGVNYGMHGYGFWKPLKVFNRKDGLELKNKLEDLKAEHRKVQEAIKEGYLSKRDEFLREYKVRLR